LQYKKSNIIYFFVCTSSKDGIVGGIDDDIITFDVCCVRGDTIMDMNI